MLLHLQQASQKFLHVQKLTPDSLHCPSNCALIKYFLIKRYFFHCLSNRYVPIFAGFVNSNAQMNVNKLYEYGVALGEQNLSLKSCQFLEHQICFMEV